MSADCPMTVLSGRIHMNIQVNIMETEHPKEVFQRKDRIGLQQRYSGLPNDFTMMEISKIR
jgi:hypothetical protein